MARLIDLLYEYPVLEALVAALPFDGLLSLARASSLYRAILHSFPAYESIKSSKIANTIRPQLFIGKHNTELWRRLKSRTVLRCSEPHHTKGSTIKGCRLCSMLVCEGCIVKTSYFSANVTMESRRRYLCGTCWNTGNRHRERQFDEAIDPKFCSYQRQAEVQGCCTCTIRDKWLCLNCKKRTPKIPEDVVQCAGEGCLTTMRPMNCGGRLCMWCELPLVEKLGREQSRRDYDLKYLSARAHSAVYVEDPGPSDDKGNMFAKEPRQLPPSHDTISLIEENRLEATVYRPKGLSSSLALSYYAMKSTLRRIVPGRAMQKRIKRRLRLGMQTE